jgi:uncharacterized cupredoxin-like copper-binding protein
VSGARFTLPWQDYRVVKRLPVFLAAGALVVSACGGSSNKSQSTPTATPKPKATATATSTSAAGGVKGKAVAIGADRSGALKFTKMTLSANAGTVVFAFANPSQVPHAFAIKGNGIDKGTKTITGGAASLTLTLKPGTYEFYCPVDGHAAAGMKGTLTVK